MLRFFRRDPLVLYSDFNIINKLPKTAAQDEPNIIVGPGWCNWRCGGVVSPILLDIGCLTDGSLKKRAHNSAQPNYQYDKFMKGAARHD